MLAALLVVALALFGLALPSAAQDGDSVTVQLGEQNGSGLSGTATLTAQGDQTLVVVAAPGGPAGTTGHVFDSSCDDHASATVFYDLTPLGADGGSETVVDQSFADLTTGDYWIHLHKPGVARGGGLLCGNVPDVRAAARRTAAFATATAVPDLIAADEPAYGLDIPTGLQFTLGDRLLVSPQPQSGAEYTVGDFVVEAEFANPAKDSDGLWDYGFLFGPTGGPDDYRIYVRSDRLWFLDLDTTTLATDLDIGPVSGLKTGPRERNTLRLIVTSGTAFFFVNGEHIATLDVPLAADGGKLWLVTSYQAERIQCWNHRVWLL